MSMFNPEFLRNYYNASIKDACHSSAICTFFLTKCVVFLELTEEDTYYWSRDVAGGRGPPLGFLLFLKKIEKK